MKNKRNAIALSIIALVTAVAVAVIFLVGFGDLSKGDDLTDGKEVTENRTPTLIRITIIALIIIIMMKTKAMRAFLSGMTTLQLLLKRNMEHFRMVIHSIPLIVHTSALMMIGRCCIMTMFLSRTPLMICL